MMTENASMEQNDNFLFQKDRTKWSFNQKEEDRMENILKKSRSKKETWFAIRGMYGYSGR